MKQVSSIYSHCPGCMLGCSVPSGLWCHHMPWTSAWSPVAAWAMDTNTVPGDSLAYRHQHDFRQPQRPRTSAWLLVVTQTTDVNVALSVASGGSTDRGHHVALCHSSGQGHHLSPQPKHRPQMSTLSERQPGPQTQTWHPEAAWIMDINNHI